MPPKKSQGLQTQLEQLSTGDLIRLWVHFTGKVPELQLPQSLQQFADKLAANQRGRAVEGRLLANVDARLKAEARRDGATGGTAMRALRVMR